MQQFALVSALFIFGGIGYRLMTKLDALLKKMKDIRRKKRKNLNKLLERAFLF